MEMAGSSSDDEIRDAAMEALRREFLPEFLNRVDETVVFHPLGLAEIRQIVDLQLRGLQKLVEENNLQLVVTDDARDLLAEEGYDPAYGARPLKRAIQQRIQNALAKELLAGRFEDGAVITVDAQAGEFTFSATEAAAV
jgi:ATP-dependent Clp protease ATP-binding subunit ClpB